MKYIITNDEQIIIFSDGFAHSDIARRFHGDVTRAGRIVLEPLSISGGSVTLKIEPYDGMKDRELIERLISY